MAENDSASLDSWLRKALVGLALSPLVLLVVSSLMSVEPFWPVALLVGFLSLACYGRVREHAAIMATMSGLSFVLLPLLGLAVGLDLALQQALGGIHEGVASMFADGLLLASPLVGMYLAFHLWRHAATTDWRYLGATLLGLHALQALWFLAMLVMNTLLA